MTQDNNSTYIEAVKEKVAEHSIAIQLILTRLHKLESRGDVDDYRNKSLDGRLLAIEDTLKWLVRLILGAFILGGVGFMLKGGFNVAP